MVCWQYCIQRANSMNLNLPENKILGAIFMFSPPVGKTLKITYFLNMYEMISCKKHGLSCLEFASFESLKEWRSARGGLEGIRLYKIGHFPQYRCLSMSFQ